MENEGQLLTTPRKSKSRAQSSTRRRRYSQERPSITDTNDDQESAITIQSPIAEDVFQCVLEDHTAHSNGNGASLTDGESDTSDSESSSSPPSSSTYRSRIVSFFGARPPSLPILYRNILKCCIAYFIASLFTFSPYLSGLISDLTSYGPGERQPSPSGHMVATIAVYFNPAKTTGAMIEADLYCLFGLLYSSFVCLASMSMFWWLELKPGFEWLGDVVAILWIGVGMSGVAWMKQWMASPSFNTACSMTSIIIFVVLVKEGGLHTLLQVTTIVLCGSVVSNLVCHFIWPQTATSNLQTNMAKTLDSFSTLLIMLTKSFLLENQTESRHAYLEKVQNAVESHQNSFTSLKKNLNEAKSEWLLRGNSDVSNSLGFKSAIRNEKARRKAYEDAVDSMNRLAQHLNGLRSGMRLQHELTQAGIVKLKNKKGKTVSEDQLVEDEEAAMLKAAAMMFGDLVDDLGPPLNALSTACGTTLTRLREAFMKSQTNSEQTNDLIQPHEFLELVDHIEHALVRFESTSNHAVLRLYRKTSISHRTSINSGRDADKENAILTEGENEHVFLVYFFIFTLQEFSRELVSLVDAMERIYTYEQGYAKRRSWWTRIASSCLFIAHMSASLFLTNPATYITPEHRTIPASFPKIKPHAPNTMQTPDRSQLTFIGRAQQRLWAIGTRLQERDAKYAIKAGMATAILASPAFFDSTRPLFVAYYGDWALISFFVVISPTIGATNYLSLQRVLGTLFGAAVAATMYTLSPENPVVLSIFGFFFSMPCFYYAVAKPEYISASRFVLLTYNLTCLFCYNLRQKDVYVWDIAFHRAVAVTAGVLWAAVVSRFWWPAEARRELSRALGEFCLNIGWLYTRLVASNSFAPDYHEATGENTDHPESASFLTRHSNTTKLNNSIHEFMSMELHLQIKLLEIQGLLAQTQHEPRLKGPFPVKLYRDILTSLQTILDKLHSMRCVTTREECVRKDFILPVNNERREMVGNIILSFSTLASAFRLKAPLPPYMPPAEPARQRLVEAIRKLDVVKNRDVKGSRQLLFFAYALTMKGVTMELESLGRTLQNVFGVIGQSVEEFEALFDELAGRS
ncbi:Fusaric acid resistance protein-like-domain-containing protein [Crucibulum laeve]|uniref:Fusaric acid resistance protein-like-domain-containing protein n=1 Tax=Crucibulum laeve TaxID=68775 RepID=A0A5C3MTE4_9AGAR|nr:Fusaric acid resistance protein-like-domain-containing protein [Crucibulum laeve]